MMHFRFAAALGALLIATPAFAADLYVSKKGGKNKNPGTKAAPLKNIQKALKKAKDGDVIHIAKGNYYGLMRKGYVEMKTPVSLIGGYSKDFRQRDVTKFVTKLQPPASSNGTASSKALLELRVKKKNVKIVIDGLVFDHGESNAYHPTKGKPSGVETGMLLRPPLKAPGGEPGKDKQAIAGRVEGQLVIKNCVFLNSHFGVQVSMNGTARIENNVFVANTMAAAELWGVSPTKRSKLVFEDNTVLFTWSRTKDMRDMGYGVRLLTGMDYKLLGNVIGFSTFAGVDNTRMEDKKKIWMDKNMFVLNKQADLALPGGGKFLRIWVADFEDLEFESNEGNLAMTKPGSLKAAINKPYMEGFIAARYKESTDFKPNSPANQARALFGLNKQGTINSSVSMWANRYPLDDALKLFGAVPGYGAQTPK